MKKWFSSLNTYGKISLICSITLLAIGLLTSPLYFLRLSEYPLGVLLGLGIYTLIIFIINIIQNKRSLSLKKSSAFNEIIIVVIRLSIIVFTLVANGLLYYHYRIHIFNLFALAGGYMIGLFITIIVSFIEGKNVIY